MDFDRYQKEAMRTDCVPAPRLFGWHPFPYRPHAGSRRRETGQLLSEYKKHLRDGEAHQLFKERVSEELGDFLWYIANVASKFDLGLDEVAIANLAKVKARWATERSESLCFDGMLPEGERLPRRFEVELVDVEGEDRQRVRVTIQRRAVWRRDDR